MAPEIITMPTNASPLLLNIVPLSTPRRLPLDVNLVQHGRSHPRDRVDYTNPHVAF